MVKHKGYSAVLLTLGCAIIAFCLVGVRNNSSLLNPLTLDSSRVSAEDTGFTDGSCKCSLNYYKLEGVMKPNLTCSCVDRATACSPASSNPVPPLQELVREVVKQVAQSSLPNQIARTETAIKELEERNQILEDELKKVASQPVVPKEVKVTQPWYVENRTWHYPARFPLCSMDACFNYSRCEGMDELKVFTYMAPVEPVRYFDTITKSKYHTDNPEEACLFFWFLDGPGPWFTHPNTAEHWNGGLNHVLISFADMWRQKGIFPDSIEMASTMVSDLHETTYRAGFDVSIPLPGHMHLVEFQHMKPFEKKYFMTFRGLRYLDNGGTGEGVFRSHDSFRNLHNGKDIIVATSCRHPVNDETRQAFPDSGAHCDEDDKLYADYEFHDLMNTTFGLVPGGIQPNSYRFIEVMSSGAIPVLIADNYVKPFESLIIWHKCLVQFPTTEMHRIADSLRRMKKEEVEKRQLNCLEIYNEFLKDDASLLRSSMRSLKSRLMGAFPRFTELRRK